MLDFLEMHTVKFGVFEQWPDLSSIGLGETLSQILPAKIASVKKYNHWYQQFTHKVIRENNETAKGVLGHIMLGLASQCSRSGQMKQKVLAEGSFTLFIGEWHY